MTQPPAREPLPAIDPALIPEGATQHYWDGVGIRESICNGYPEPLLSDNWAAVNCGDCRDIGQSRQPIIPPLNPGDPGYEDLRVRRRRTT